MKTKTFIEKVNYIQVELNAPKNQFNSFGKYKYRSCEDILQGIKPLLKETGLILKVSDEIISVGERIYVRATATLLGSDGEELSSTAMAREPENKKGMDESQITGTASSYARKYALNGLLAIDDAKDADSQDNRSNGQKKASNDDPNARPTEKQLGAMFYKVKENDCDLNDFNFFVKEKINLKQYKWLMDNFTEENFILTVNHLKGKE
jgi:hypothetical protein